MGCGVVFAKNLGDHLYKFGKIRNRLEEMELPKQAFAVIPISDVFERVSEAKLFENCWVRSNTNHGERKGRQTITHLAIRLSSMVSP